MCGQARTVHLQGRAVCVEIPSSTDNRLLRLFLKKNFFEISKWLASFSISFLHVARCRAARVMIQSCNSRTGGSARGVHASFFPPGFEDHVSYVGIWKKGREFSDVIVLTSIFSQIKVASNEAGLWQECGSKVVLFDLNRSKVSVSDVNRSKNSVSD